MIYVIFFSSDLNEMRGQDNQFHKLSRVVFFQKTLVHFYEKLDIMINHWWLHTCADPNFFREGVQRDNCVCLGEGREGVIPLW